VDVWMGWGGRAVEGWGVEECVQIEIWGLGA